MKLELVSVDFNLTFEKVWPHNSRSEEIQSANFGYFVEELELRRMPSWNWCGGHLPRKCFLRLGLGSVLVVISTPYNTRHYWVPTSPDRNQVVDVGRAAKFRVAKSRDTLSRVAEIRVKKRQRWALVALNWPLTCIIEFLLFQKQNSKLNFLLVVFVHHLYICLLMTLQSQW